MAFPETDSEKLWTAVVVGVLGVLIVGSLLFRDAVYGGFVWHYFWGPVYADAHGAACATWNAGSPTLYSSAATCRTATGIVAYPGYSPVSEIGYAITLLTALAGLVFLLRRLDLGDSLDFVLPLVPFMFFGGALRTIEDAMDTIPAGVDASVHYPLNALLISPLIYFTVFVLTLAALLVAVYLHRSGVTETYEWPLAAMGTGLLLVPLAYEIYLAGWTDYVSFHPIFSVLTLLLAGLIAGGLWWTVREYYPAVAAGTERIGVVILFAHAVDGVSNVLGIDWGHELGLPADLVPKHPLNRAIIEASQTIIPHSVAAVVGTAWPFLLVKLLAALFVIYLFDREMIAENPRFSVLLLVAVIAVGLGPGTRDMLRATFGI